MNDFRVLEELLLTEKSNVLSAGFNKYVFKVCSCATKFAVAAAVEKTFKVTVTSVNMLNTNSKLKRARVRGAHTGRIRSFKKAIVSLKQGDKIEII